MTSLRRRASPAALVLTGFVAGALVAGLVIPFAVGEDDRGVHGVTALRSVPTVVGDTTETSPTPGETAVPGAGASTGAQSRSARGATPGQAALGAGGARAGTSAANTNNAGAPSVAQRGVTANEVLVGIPIINVNEVGSAAGLNPAGFDERPAWQAFIDAVNADPIHGRKLRAVYESYNALDTADTLRACAALTEDRKVFAVLAYSFFGDAGTCVSVQHRTLMLNYNGYLDDQYARSAGRMFSQAFSKTRINRIWAQETHRLGLLAGKKLGVVTGKGGDDNIPVEQALLPTLRRLGHTIARVTTLDVDLAVAQGQIPLEVAQMRQAGVQKVFFGANALFLARFAQEADRQGWRPEYLVSDHADADAEFLTSSYPASFQGVGITGQRYGEQTTSAPEAPRDARCRATYERATGKRYARGSANYQLVMHICSTVQDVLAAALRAAGPALTTESFTAAAQRLGRLDLAFANGGSLRPGKFDAMDNVRTVRFRQDCDCWAPLDAFRAAPT